jgi:predicted lipid-binding transport protein (Tim44 family)
VIAYDLIGYILLAYVLTWAVALAYMMFLTLVLAMSRGRSDMVRDIFRRAVAAQAPPGSVHAVSQISPPSRVAARITELQAKDPDFDLTAFLDNTRVAVGACAMAWSAEDDRLLRRITTPGLLADT